jgi:dipeptidyl-peptidase-4
MRPARHAFAAIIALGLAVALQPAASAQAGAGSPPTIAQFLSPASPVEVTAAKKADRVAWIAYEQGRRNVYTAAAPAFMPVRLTKYLKDDGVDLTEIRISGDGSTVAFVRGSAANRAGWHANPSGDPNGGEEAVWAAHVATPGVSWRVVEGNNPQLSPDGRWVAISKGGQIYRAAVTPARAATAMDRGEKPFISEWGTNGNPVWSPDGLQIAFVSNRGDHSLIAIHHVKTRTITYLAPSVDFDTNPVWSADSARIVFTRRPGTPFALQAQAGGGGIGLSAGPAFQEQAGRAGGEGRPGGAGRAGGTGRAGEAGRAGRAGQAGEAGQGGRAGANVPGLASSTFTGGYTQSIWTADAATGAGREVWHNQPNDRLFAAITNIRWAGDRIVFPLVVGGGRGGRGQAETDTSASPQDEWDRYYSLDVTKPNATPVLLTTTDGLIEDQTSSIVSADGRTFYYSTNAKDIERRHIWAVPTAGGEPVQVTLGQGIETFPAPLASGKAIATLSASWNIPMSLGIWPTASPRGAAAGQKIIFPVSRPSFAAAAHVEPQLVMTKAADGLDIHNQLFLPKDVKPGEKRPAIIFVHGGPVRQMLLGYHYRYVYHQFYGINEWLAAHGYVVLSVNYRSGIGYGRSFRNAPNTEARGNSEYQDVVAGARYLQSRPDVDASRIGIYGLSYGGLLTAQALARNSDIFAAGVDYAGVHLYGSSLDPSDVSYQSSAISQIDNWKSPVLLIQGDDDRNVNFAQTVGLVQLLRQRNVYHELIVFPDDVHDSLIYSRWIYLCDRMDTFLQKFLGDTATKKITTSGR